MIKGIKFSNSDSIKYIEKNIKDNSVDLFYVDPPYGRNYKEWDESNIEEFINTTETWVKLFVKKLKDNGTMWVFMDKSHLFANKNKKLRKGVINILEEYGTVHLDNLVTWKRQKGRESKSRLKSLREEIIHFTKHPKNFTWNNVQVLKEVIAPYVKDGRPRGWFTDDATGKRVKWTGIGNVWLYSAPMWNGKLDKARHSAQKPLLLAERIILLSSNPGDLVIDPFMGSGTAAIVSKYRGRNYLGIEKDKKIFKETLSYYVKEYKNVEQILKQDIQRVMK